MHGEQLELRADSFTHYISTDVGEPGRTTGSYRIRADTLYLAYGQAADQEEDRQMREEDGESADEIAESPYPQRFLLDTIRGRAILWRSADAKRRYERTDSISPYSVLIAVGSDSESSERASCAPLW
jgi:hypothetical protein